jgi:hypothetical protein
MSKMVNLINLKEENLGELEGQLSFLVNRKQEETSAD